MLRKIIRAVPWEKGKKGKVYNPCEKLYYHQTELTDVEIVQLAYLVRDFLEPLMLDNPWLSWKKRKSYKLGFYLSRNLLDLIGLGPQDHPELQEFFRKDRELDSDDDYLCWRTKEEVEKIDKECEPKYNDGSVEIVHHY